MKHFCRRIGAVVLTLVVGLAALCPAALAVQLPSLSKDQCVVDDAGVLSQSTYDYMNELNGKLEASCSGAQIGVLTVQYTGNASTEEYALEAFNAWGIGDASKNNGVLILLVMESPYYVDGDYYLTYGDGFRNTTLDKQASAIAQTMEDDFAARRYDAAIEVCAENVANTIADIYGVALEGGQYNEGGQPQKKGFAYVFDTIVTWFFVLLVGFIILMIVFGMFISPIGHALGWYWGPFGWFRPRGPRPPRPPRGPGPGGPGMGGPRPPRPPQGGMGGGRPSGGSFGGGSSFGGGGFGGMGGGMSHGGGGGRGR